MLNKDRKEAFIKENLNEVFTERFLRQIGEYEDILQKDCCDFNIKEITMFYKLKDSASPNSLDFLNNTYRRYTDYCLKHNMVIDNQNHYSEMNMDMFLKCISSIKTNGVITREYIRNLQSTLPNISDGALLLALFEGICGKDMCELIALKPEDFKNNTVHLCTGRELEVSTELEEWCKESAVTMQYNSYMETNRTLTYNEVDTVFKSTGRNINGVNRKTLYNKLMRIKDAIGIPYLTTFSLMTSGRIEMIKKIMETEGKTLEQILHDRSTEYRYGRILNLSLWENKYGEYLK